MGRSRRGSVPSAAQVCLAFEECGQDFLAAAPHLARRRSAEDRSLSRSSTRRRNEANYRVPEDPGGGSPGDLSRMIGGSDGNPAHGLIDLPDDQERTSPRGQPQKMPVASRLTAWASSPMSAVGGVSAKRCQRVLRSGQYSAQSFEVG